METIAPFRAWRYAPAAGDLNRLVAPPYDVIDPPLQSRLYAASPHNVVRVDLGMTTPSDNDCDNQYTRAAAQLEQWKGAGILVRDPVPSVTFVEESFTGPDGRARVRHGCLAAMRLYGFDDQVVFPHECTLTGPKEDRFRLMEATAMNLSPVFLLYDLPGDDVTRAWRSGPGAGPPSGVIAGEGGAEGDTVTSLWPTTDPALLETLEDALAAGRFVIADGHHRYETALRYREQRESAEPAGREAPGRRGEPGDLPPRRAYDYCLAYFCNMADPALAIYATHRLIAGLSPDAVASLPEALSRTFTVEPLASAGRRRDLAAIRESVGDYLRAHPRRAFCLWGPGFATAYGLFLADPARAHAAARDHSAAYLELDVTILQTLVFEQILGVSEADLAAEKYVTYFKDPAEAFARLQDGDFQAGFFMNPTGLDQIRRVAFAGDRMPQKATFFYPKLPTGLVFHDLAGAL